MLVVVRRFLPHIFNGFKKRKCYNQHELQSILYKNLVLFKNSKLAASLCKKEEEVA
jgi:hypothetical protein